MLPFVIVFGQNLFGAFYSLLSRRLSVKLPDAQVHVTAVLFTIGVVIAVPAALWYGDVHLASLTKWWPYILLGGFATVMNAITMLLIFKYMDAAMGTLLGTTHIVMAFAAGMYVLGERMGMQELAGAVLVLAAVGYALSVHVSRRERRNWTLGIFYALASAVFFSVAVMVEKFLLGEMSVSSYVVWGFGVQWLIAVLLAVCLGWRAFAKVLAPRNASLLLAAGLTRISMGVLFVLSLVVLRSLCLAVILAGLRPLFVAFLGAAFLHERRFLIRKVIASLVAATGVAIMFWK
jgi:drug/metabolite transporter (DMT)-like permease